MGVEVEGEVRPQRRTLMQNLSISHVAAERTFVDAIIRPRETREKLIQGRGNQA